MLCEPQADSRVESVKSALPAGVPPLSTLYLYIAGACNLACRHCWIVPGFDPAAASGKFLPLDLAHKAVAQGLPLGLSAAKLTGGEPMLHPQFREIVTILADAGLAITIETNGTLVDDDLARFLGARGVQSISVSLDGADAATHDALRGVAGSFQQSVAGIRALAAAGMKPQAICTLHRGNASQMQEVIALALSLGCGSVKFNHVQSIGRGARMKEVAGLEVTEILSLYQEMEQKMVPACAIPVYFDVPWAFRPIRSLLRPDLGQCGILRILGILSGGEVSLCGVGVTVPQLIYGRLASDDLASIWRDSPGLVELRRLVPQRLDGICGRCVHRDFCMGECVAQIFFEERRLNGAFPFCAAVDARGAFPPSRLRASASREPV